MKPELPQEIQLKFPVEIVSIINSFVPHFPKRKDRSPALQRELERIQRSPLKGKNEMYMKHLEEFILE